MKISRLGKIHKFLLGKYHLKSRRFIYLLKGKINWIFPTMNFFLKNHNKTDKRLLLIWDLSVHPYAVGELIILHELAQILRLKYKIDKIDFCFVCNPKNPVGDYPGITSENFYTKLPTLVSTVYLNPHIGNFFIFDSNNDLEHFIKNNIEKYYIWPDFKNYIAKNIIHEESINLIQKFYLEKEFIPYLDYRKHSIKWASNFYKQNIFPKFPVAIQLRNNPLHGITNAKLDEWLKFFKKANKKFKNVKFILIGDKKEIDNKFRNLSNLIIAKDYNTTVEQDLVLAITSLIYMGSQSGPNMSVIFSKKPYILFGMRQSWETIHRGNKKYSFSTKNQILNWGPETEKQIMEQFSEIYVKIDKDKWKQNIEKYADKK